MKLKKDFCAVNERLKSLLVLVVLGILGIYGCAGHPVKIMPAQFMPNFVSFLADCQPAITS